MCDRPVTASEQCGFLNPYNTVIYDSSLVRRASSIIQELRRQIRPYGIPHYHRLYDTHREMSTV